MAINLTDYESGAAFTGDYDRMLAEIQDRLSRIATAHIVHNKRTIILIEGWDGAGKGGIIQRLAARLDPRHLKVWPIGPRSDAELGRHFLWRFWKHVPGPGEIALFERSWYGRVLSERVDGIATESEWRRAYDEINEFEAQLTSDGTAIIKLFIHVGQAVQDQRLASRLAHPWKRLKLSAEVFRSRDRRSDYLVALRDMFATTDTRWARWQIIDGNDKRGARIAALSAVADALEAAVPSLPPPAPEDLEAIMRQALSFAT